MVQHSCDSITLLIDRLLGAPWSYYDEQFVRARMLLYPGAAYPPKQIDL
jgi:hypothetical protein